MKPLKVASNESVKRFNKYIQISYKYKYFCFRMNEPQQFKGDLLPTKLDLLRHYLYLISVKSGTKEWTQFTPLSVKIDAVCEDLASIWNKTGIPHQLTDRVGKKKVASVIAKGKSLQKHMNKEKFEDLNKLFDVARC